MKKRCIMCYSAKTQQDGRFFCAECDDSFSQIEILLDNVASLKDSFPSPPMAGNSLMDSNILSLIQKIGSSHAQVISLGEKQLTLKRLMK